MNKLLIVIPTYNEVQSAPQLIEDLLLLNIDIDFLIVDDGSTDQTVEACQSIDLSKHASVLNILQRRRKLGLASAYIEGFSWAISANYKFVAQMDADGSHRPVYLALMYEKQIQAIEDELTPFGFYDDGNGDKDPLNFWENQEKLNKW